MENIKKVLQLFIEHAKNENDSVLYLGETIRIKMISSNCLLDLALLKSNKLKVSLEYINNNFGNRDNRPEHLIVTHWESLQPLLREIIKIEQDDKNKYNYVKEGKEDYEEKLNLFKDILAHRSIPSHYTYSIKESIKGINKDKTQRIEVIDNRDFRKHYCDIKLFDISSKSLLTTSSLEIYITPNNYKKAIRHFKLIIPSFDLHHYPLLHYHDKRETQDENVWINNIINHENVPLLGINKGLNALILEDKLLTKDQFSSIKKIKI